MTMEALKPQNTNKFDSIDYQSLKLAVESGKINPTQYGFMEVNDFLRHIDDCWDSGKTVLLDCYLTDYRFSYDFV